jgi:hypothetical protein
MEYGNLAPVYITGSTLSLVGLTVVVVVLKRSRRQTLRSSTTTLLLMTTVFDCLYSLKFLVSAVAFELGASDPRHSFHLIPDDCLSSVLYEHVIGMTCICLNAVCFNRCHASLRFRLCVSGCA